MGYLYSEYFCSKANLLCCNWTKGKVFQTGNKGEVVIATTVQTQVDG